MPIGMPLSTYGLLPAAEPQGGLLGDMFMDPRRMAMLSAAASLLEGGGPSLTPTSFGQNLGRATMAGMNTYQQGRQQAVQNALLKRQMARQDKQDARADSDFARQEQLREMFPSAFNEDGSVNPAVIPDIARVSPGVATQLAGMIETPQSTPPDYRVVTRTNPDGTTQQGRIDISAPNPDNTFTPIGNPEVPSIPVEAAGRLGLATTFLEDVPEIRKAIKDGKLTGPYDVSKARMGIGEAGRLYARIESGVDALRRTLSGAGMPAEEAAQYVRRYQPSFVDTDETLLAKLEQLESELKGNVAAIMQGRGGVGSLPNPPDANSGGWSIQAVE